MQEIGLADNSSTTQHTDPTHYWNNSATELVLFYPPLLNYRSYRKCKDTCVLVVKGAERVNLVGIVYKIT